MSLEERLAIEEFETLATAMMLRGYFKPGGDSGASLRQFMEKSEPALYPYVRDPDRIDIGALNYVLNRLPDGFWQIRQITISRQISSAVEEDFASVETSARRRPTYRTGTDSYVTAFRGGLTDLLDFVSAITCYQIEADKIRAKYQHYKRKRADDPTQFSVWDQMETLQDATEMPAEQRNSLLHALSVEFRADYAAMKELDAALSGRLPEVVLDIIRSGSKDLKVVFTDTFGLVGDYSLRAKAWSASVCESIEELGLGDRPIFLVSSNRHSVVNCLSPYVRESARKHGWEDPDDYGRLKELLKDESERRAKRQRDAEGGIHLLKTSPHMPFCQLIDAPAVDLDLADSRLRCQERAERIVLNMDYAFGEEGFFLLNELLETLGDRIRAVYIMGKAGTLVGKRGDIMLPTFFVRLGAGDVYEISNCLDEKDFEGQDDVVVHSGGPMLTAAGTFLQNRAVLKYFRDRWHSLGVEMEGTPYARALAQAKLRKRVGADVDVGVAYYASDAPMSNDLLTMPLGSGGIGPAYAITAAILRNILRRTT